MERCPRRGVLSPRILAPGRPGGRRGGSRHLGGPRPHAPPPPPSPRRSSSAAFSEVAQLSFEIAGVSSLSGTQPIAWQLEYPHAGAAGSAVSQIFVSQQDLVGIVPLATVRRARAWVRPVASGCGSGTHRHACHRPTRRGAPALVQPSWVLRDEQARLAL
ncbi:hypothetical protein QTO34_011803 [Cnephaeus nilssonii]|uniref:Transmembrane protein TMEM132 cohesin-like domain-containing protein n=1 Tax=Cnephaeus nilssonii TaxID=3371016 RepID=A0AA40HCP7_CNENI|nr:hypothetical protein QTO34_011803 [Eptesicus nilssonii]